MNQDDACTTCSHPRSQHYAGPAAACMVGISWTGDGCACSAFTTEPPHTVPAVAEALYSRALTLEHGLHAAELRPIAEAAVAALEPYIAARIAAETEALRRTYTTTEDTMPMFENPRAVHFPESDEGEPDAWHVQAGPYHDDPDVNIVIEHAVDGDGNDNRAAVAAALVRALVVDQP